MPIIAINLDKSQIDFFNDHQSLSRSAFIRECMNGHPQYANWKYKRDKIGYGR